MAKFIPYTLNTAFEEEEKEDEKEEEAEEDEESEKVELVLRSGGKFEVRSGVNEVCVCG